MEVRQLGIDAQELQEGLAPGDTSDVVKVCACGALLNAVLSLLCSAFDRKYHCAGNGLYCVYVYCTLKETTLAAILASCLYMHTGLQSITAITI